MELYSRILSLPNLHVIFEDFKSQTLLNIRSDPGNLGSFMYKWQDAELIHVFVSRIYLFHPKYFFL